jgi:hypothetical protein
MAGETATTTVAAWDGVTPSNTLTRHDAMLHGKTWLNWPMATIGSLSRGDGLGGDGTPPKWCLLDVRRDYSGQNRATCHSTEARMRPSGILGNT